MGVLVMGSWVIIVCIAAWAQLVSSLGFDLQSAMPMCPLSISPNPPLQVTGSYLEKSLASKQNKGFISVLFYAPSCPFSRRAYSKFEAISSMFPQIQHFSIEQSSAMPSVLSRYGIHSVPSILVVNQTSRVRYYGPKDLVSIVEFYKKTTGLAPVQYLEDNDDQSNELHKTENPREIWRRDSYLVLSVLFLCLRALVPVFPRVMSRLKAIWVPHLGLGVLGGTSQMIGRVIDVSGFWTKLRRSKSRNLREGARNARVWASSFASVSLAKQQQDN